MTNILQKTAFASSISLDEETNKIIDKYNSIILKKGIALSPNILIEIGEFVKRNRILAGDVSILEEDFCPDCLKAHIIKQAISLGMHSGEVKILDKSLPGKHGHEGYYSDEDEILKAD